MAKTCWSGVCAVIVSIGTAAIGAQTSSTTPQTAGSTADQKITVTGCLKQAPPSSATGTTGATTATPGTTGTTGTTPTPGTVPPPAGASDAMQSFVLADAMATPAAASTAAGSAPGTPSTGAAAAPTDPNQPKTTYRLIANPSALSPHVGKKLELTGTIEAAATGNTPSLRVQEGKIVAPTCDK